MGRTKRRRRKSTVVEIVGFSLSHEKVYVSLNQWMKRKGFNNPMLIPATFSITGIRGIYTKKRIHKEDCIISLPECLLIGVRKALQDSVWLAKIMNYNFTLTSMQILCVFLLEEKWKADENIESDWQPYFYSLPEKFSHHLFWNNRLLEHLPDKIYSKTLLQKAQVLEQFTEVQMMFSQGSIVNKNMSFSEYCWAWCCVNSRCVYSDHEDLSSLKQVRKTAADNYYLAPFLDLLNHNPVADVSGKFNTTSRCYEIHTNKELRPYSQVFIKYGSHSTSDLFLEYGFVPFTKNLNDELEITKEEVMSLTGWANLFCNDCLPKIYTLLDTHGLSRGLNLSHDGVSYNLQLMIFLFANYFRHDDHKCICKKDDCKTYELFEKLISGLHRDFETYRSEDIINRVNKLKHTVVHSLHASFLLGFKSFCMFRENHASEDEVCVGMIEFLWEMIFDILCYCEKEVIR